MCNHQATDPASVRMPPTSHEPVMVRTQNVTLSSASPADQIPIRAHRRRAIRMRRMDADFGKAAADYGTYRAGFPDKFFERLATYGIGRPGQRVLDLGTGTGTVARGLAGRGCIVTGLDRSADLIEEAKRLDRQAGVTVHYVVAGAEHTGFADDGFDVVTAGQCWHWFDHGSVARGVRRLLVSGGRFVIAQFDWLPHRGNGSHPDYVRDVAVAGFDDIETFSFDVPVSYSHEAWRGRIRASAGVAASLEPDRVARFDAELAELLTAHFPRQPLQIPHRVSAVVSRSP